METGLEKGLEAGKGKGVWYLSGWKLGDSLKSGFGQYPGQESGWLLTGIWRICRGRVVCGCQVSMCRNHTQ